MRILPNTGKNLVIVLALLAAGFLVAYLRFRPYLGREATYTDGAHDYSVASGERLRYAIWDAPEPLGKEVNTPSEESRPALTPDGRFVVFAVGKLGLNADLWIAECVGGEPVDAHPLGAVNTDSDEVSPSFTADGRALLFSSNRPGGAGGLDVWRAPYADGAFGAAAALGPEVNTVADECDPASVPGGDAIAFASNRPRGARRDFDLFVTVPGPNEALALLTIDSPFDEREPAFASDGRALLFASNRSGGAGGFDLYRSVLGETGWMAPEALIGINTDASERGPAPTADGFSMLFAVERNGESSDLFRARSLELLRVPGRPVGWQDLTLLALLLLVALFAMLAKRWKQLDVIYKCLLVSLVVHLLLLWLSNMLFVGGGTPGGIPSRGDGLIKVRRLDAGDLGAPNGTRERGGRIEAMRGTDASAGDETADGPARAKAGGTPSTEPIAGVANLTRPAGPADAAPGRAGEVVSRGDTPPDTAVPLQDGDADFPRMNEGAPGVDVTASTSGGSRSDGTSPGLARATLVLGSSVDTGAGSGPSRASLTRGSGPEVVGPGRGNGKLEPTAGDGEVGGLGVEVATPRESVARSEGNAPALSVAPTGATGRAASVADAPTRGAGEAGGGGPGGSGSGAPEISAPMALALGPMRRSGGTGDVAPPAAAADSMLSGAPASRDVAGVPLQDRVPIERLGGNGGGGGSGSGGGTAGAAGIGAVTPHAWSGDAREVRGGDGGPERRSVGGGASAGTATPGQIAGGGLERLPGPTDGGGSEGGASDAIAAARRGSAAAPSGARGLPPVGVRGPNESARALLGDGGTGSSDGTTDGVALAPRALGGRSPAGAGEGGAGGASAGPARFAGSGTAGGAGSGSGAPVSAPVARGVDRPTAGRNGDGDGDGVASMGTGRGGLGATPTGERGVPSVAVQTPSEPAHVVRNEPGSGHSAPHDFDVAPRAVASRQASPSGTGDPEPRRVSSDVAVADARPNPQPMDVAPAAEVVAAPTAPDRGRLEATPYRNRFGAEKAVALRDHGGSAETENAVASGLRYLARIQNESGYWGDPDHIDEKYGAVMIGKSALSLLAFLGAGHTPGSNTTHAKVAERAVSFLLASQDERTGHFGDSEAYSNGIATYALAECYALTKDVALRAPLERAIGHIVANQNHGRDTRRIGGWSYYYPDGHVFDAWPRVSITAWQVMALESARLGGLDVPDRVFDDAKSFLLGSYDKRHGYFRYSQDPERLNSEYRTLPGSTPAALFALALLGEDTKSSRFEKARDFVLDRAPDGYRYTSDADFVERGMGNLYFWYYGTLALFRCEGDEWELWNAKMKQTLLPSQEKDGSWKPIDIYARYAGDDRNDRTYTTAMCVLALEVYYRYFTPLLKVR